MARPRASLTSHVSLGSIVGLYGLRCFTSLAYQVVWINLLAAEVGRTLSAMGLVMAVFPAGLGLGAAGLAWQVQRHMLSPHKGTHGR